MDTFAPYTMARLRVMLGQAAVAACFVALTAVGCRLVAPPAPDIGTLRVALSRMSAQTLLPDLDMVPASYVVTGSGPGGATFTATTTGGTLLVPDLAVGSWTVTVDAENAAAVVVGRGADAASVDAGVTTPLTIAVIPIAGFGTFTLSVSWPPAQVQTPAIDAQLLPAVGAALPLDFTIDAAAGTASYSNTAAPSGYYTLIMQLTDGGIPVIGAVETARIVHDATTSGSYQFSEVNQVSGSLSIEIVPRMDEPIDVVLTGQVAQLDRGQSMTVTASAPAESVNVVYAWYLNGLAAATGASLTIGTSLDPGVYRLDVTAFTADGSRGGSASHSFNVADTMVATASWEPNQESDLAGYRLHYGTTSGVYDTTVDVGATTSYTLTGLDPQTTYYVTATSYDTEGLESEFSPEVVLN